MNGWMKAALSLSLSGALVVAALLPLARLLGKRLGRAWQYYIWLVAVLRLLLPVAAPVNMVGSLLAGSPAPQVSTPAPPETQTSGESATFTLPNAAEFAPVEPERPPAAIPPAALAAGLWLAVAGGLLVRKGVRCGRAVRATLDCAEAPGVLEAPFTRACEACGLRKQPRLIVSSAAPSPAAVGVLRPAVVMPAGFDPAQAYYVFLHELTHVRRRDALYKWFVELAVSLHWWNPAVYVLRREAARACELACDEAVLARLDGGGARAYGDTLLAALRCAGAPVRASVGLPLGENAKWMKERLGAIMGFRKKGKLCGCVAVTLTAALACGAVLCGFSPAQWGMSAAGGAAVSEVVSRLKTMQFPVATQNGSERDIPDRMDWDSSDVLRRDDQKGYQANLYLSNGYIVALAWNVDSARYDTVLPVEGLPLSFSAKTARYANDAAVMQAVQSALQMQKEKNRGGFPLQEPVLLGIDGPFSGTPDELAVRFYDADNIGYYATAIVQAGTETRDTIAERAYTDDREDYFTIAIDKTDSQVSQSKLKALATRAARDGKPDFFAIASDNLPASTLKAFAEEAYTANHVDIFAIATDKMQADELLTFARRAAQDNRQDFFAIATDGLPDATVADFAADAYAGNNIDIFYMTRDALSAAQALQYAEKAYTDDRIDFFYAVRDALSSAQLSEFASRAERDNKEDFFYAAKEW